MEWRDGKIGEVAVATGDQVEDGAVLVRLEAIQAGADAA